MQDELFWQLALSVNAAFKGLLGANGQSGHICSRALGVPTSLSLNDGWQSVCEQIAFSLPDETASGDVVVVADKVVAVALNRIAPREIIQQPDPKTVSADQLLDLAQRWGKKLPFNVEPHHLILADEYECDQATVGTDFPNQRSAELAVAINKFRQLEVDVIVSDTDTGLDIRRPLIGIVTIAATPLGATAGVNLYEAMRCAVAAEFVRGHTLGIPVVICVPAERRRLRESIGKPRPYAGLLNAQLESGVSHA
jgi:F420-0:gamma-glutamyl ligase